MSRLFLPAECRPTVAARAVLVVARSSMLRAATAVAGGREFREAFGVDGLTATDAGPPGAIFDAVERQPDVLNFLFGDSTDGGECFVVFHGESVVLPVGVTWIAECRFDLSGALQKLFEFVLEALTEFVQVGHVRILA